MFDAIYNFVMKAQGIFALGGQVFMGYINGMVPMLLMMVTFMNTIISYIGVDRFEAWGRKICKYEFLSYTILAFLGVVLMPGLPGLVLIASFLPDEQKIPFVDGQFCMSHASLGIFPQVNSAEIWVYAGFAAGIEALGYSSGPFAVRCLLSALIMMPIRAYATKYTMKIIRSYNNRKKEKAEAAAQAA